jgi:voltage-dependent calcium channel alpha-2/delta-4
LEVNTTHSSVHVPTNVYDQGAMEWEFIQWSEVLDEVFTQNYQSDPALSWQYFGSNVGIMRHFPAISWNRNLTDTYDCRKRSWYIETATCSKDVVILLDNSGSMTGYRNFIARHTIKNLLETFSNNDFINILSYSNVTKGSIIPCFSDILVQATPDNINAFNEAVKELTPELYGNVTIALDAAFTLLEQYRTIRKCNESSTGCNQAIMLITDGVPGNATEIFQKYNEFGSNKTAPVRVFTYLLGKEVTKVKEIQLYACLNRGHYSHIQTIDEISGEVLKYVNVIAAPLVLQKLEHPPTWTHAYIGEVNQTENDKVKVDKTKTSRLMIAVGVPAFNMSSYGEGNYTGRPTLLGVAGTDIQLEDVRRLALPYKLGVNAYSFIVSNNGYVLLHPDLRPIDPNFPERVKENYNSMDLTEVEQFMEDVEPRVPCTRLQDLRRGMVMAQTSKEINISVKFHYDSMRRVAEVSQDFYFTPIPHTPFSLGIGKLNFLNF